MNTEEKVAAKTQIITNGSRFAGQKPASLEELYIVLQEHPLGDFWQKNGCEYADRETGITKFWGNFEDISHAFDVETSDPATASRLRRLILENIRRPPIGHRGERVTCPCAKAHFGKFEEAV